MYQFILNTIDDWAVHVVRFVMYVMDNFLGPSQPVGMLIFGLVDIFCRVGLYFIRAFSHMVILGFFLGGFKNKVNGLMRTEEEKKNVVIIYNEILRQAATLYLLFCFMFVAMEDTYREIQPNK